MSKQNMQFKGRSSGRMHRNVSAGNTDGAIERAELKPAGTVHAVFSDGRLILKADAGLPVPSQVNQINPEERVFSLERIKLVNAEIAQPVKQGSFIYTSTNKAGANKIGKVVHFVGNVKHPYIVCTLFPHAVPLGGTGEITVGTMVYYSVGYSAGDKNKEYARSKNKHRMNKYRKYNRREE